MNTIIRKELEENNIVWFKNSNSYLVLDSIVAELLEKLDQQINTEEIFRWLKAIIEFPENTLKQFIDDTTTLYHQNSKIEDEVIASSKKWVLEIPKIFYSEKHYRIHNFVFFIQSENEYLESQFHPIFAHLEIDKESSFDFHYQVFQKEDAIMFVKNKKLIGQWFQNESHFFQGKLSMHLLIDMYQKPEEKWMGIFHASAISNGKESMLFLGDSGSGKSTSLALLNANGFDCVADDFVPIDSEKNIRTYPAAVSIKKQSVPALLPFYPELENSAEYHFKRLHKIVRFLPPKKTEYKNKLTCKALVFIRYNPEVVLEINSISKTEAFQQLVPDSWISPIKENAEVFLDWFLDLPCYQLTYSDNAKMITTVSKLFKDEL